MELIRSRFGIDDDLRAATPSEFSGIGVCQYFEFLNCIKNWTKREVVNGRIIVIDTIEKIAVRGFSGAGSIESTAKAQNGTRRRRDGTGHQLRERLELPPVERQLRDLSVVDNDANRRTLRLDEWRRLRNSDAFGDFADLKDEVDAQAVIDAQLNVLSAAVRNPSSLYTMSAASGAV